MVREIVRRARDPVKSRTVVGEVQVKYKAKLAKLEEDVALVLEEEKADRELAKCENRAGKLQNRLAGEEDDRAWFQSKQQRKEEKQALKKKMKDPTFTTQKKKRKEALTIDPGEEKEMRGLNNEADWVARGAKKAKQLKKIRKVVDDDLGPSKAKKQKKKSSFEDGLTDTSNKSVKAFRHVANKRKNDDRRANKKKPKGGGGGKNKGGGGMNKEQRKGAKKSSFK